MRGVEPCGQLEEPMVSVVDGGNKSTLNLATRVESFADQTTAPAILQALSERMMGLEPTTFCMASTCFGDGVAPFVAFSRSL